MKGPMYYMRLGTYETLYFMQKNTFFNTIYYGQAVVSFMCVLTLPLSIHFAWDHDLMAYPDLILHIAAVAIHSVKKNIFMPFFIIAGVHVSITVFMGIYIGYGLITSTFERTWVAALFRKMLGFCATFYDMFFRIFMAPLDCNFFDEQTIIATSAEFVGETCNADGVGVAKFVFSAVLALMFFWLIVAGSIAHVNDPKSFSVVARPHSIQDCATYSSILLETTMFIFFRKFPKYLCVIFFCNYLCLFLFCSTCQPYYSRTMTDLKSCFFCGITWTAIMFIIVNIPPQHWEPGAHPGYHMDDHGLATILSIVYLCGLPFAMAFGGFFSSWWRRRCVRLALEPYKEFFVDGRFSTETPVVHLQNPQTGRWKFQLELQEEGIMKLPPRLDHDSKERIKDQLTMEPLVVQTMNGDRQLTQERCNVNGPPALDDAEVFQLVADSWRANVAMSISDWWKAIQVEVGTRFLQYDKQNISPPAEMLDIAEHILKRGLANHPQSVYLQLQYCFFIVAYRQRYEFALTTLEGVEESYPLNILLGFSVFRKRKDLDRIKQESHFGATDSLDTMGFEEVKKMNKVAVHEHRNTLKCIGDVWRVLNATGESKVSEQMLTTKLERVMVAERTAEYAYHYVLDRCNDATTILKQYAVFVRTVKKDFQLSAVIDERVALLSADKGDGGGSVGGSTKGAGTNANLQAKVSDLALKRHDNKRVIALKRQLFALTFLILSVMISLLLSYWFLIDRYRTVLLNLEESGLRTFFCQELMAGARETHVAAARNDDEKFVESRSALKSKLDVFFEVHHNLYVLMDTELDQLNAFYNEPVEMIRVRYPNYADKRDWKERSLSGYDIASQIIYTTYALVEMPMERWQQYKKGAAPGDLPQLYFLLENGNLAGQAMDEATGLYVQEVSWSAQRMRIIFLALIGAGALFELCLVIGVFRRAVESMFSELHRSLNALQVIPIAVVKYKVDLENLRTQSAEDRKKRKKQAEEASAASGSDVADEESAGSDIGGRALDSSAHSSDAESDDDLIEEGAGGNVLKKGNDEDQQSTRRKLITIFYWCCLFGFWMLAGIVAYLCVSVVTEAEDSAVELNASSRRRFVGRRMTYLAKEIVWSESEATQLTFTNLRVLDHVDNVRCFLRATSAALLSSHYALVWGKQQGWYDLPAAQEFRRPLWSTAEECSPFTWDKDIFVKAMQTKGSIGRVKSIDDTLFESNCLASLDSPSGDILLYDNERLTGFASNLKPELCPKNGANVSVTHVLQQGLHNLVFEMGQNGLRLSRMPSSEQSKIMTNSEEFRWISEFDRPEYYLGMLKVTLLYQSEVLQSLANNTSICMVAFLLVMAIAVAQYLFLGKEIESLMREHQRMNDVVERLLAEAVELEKTVKLMKETEKTALSQTASRSEQDDPLSDRSIDGFEYDA